MNIRFAKNKEITSGLIPCFAYGKTEEIVIICASEDLAETLGFEIHYDMIKDMLNHESMHIVLHRLFGETVSHAYDLICLKVEE